MKIEKQDKQHKTDAITRIHNARFYNLAPRGIICMDYNKINHKLALARNDGSLEIWNMEHTPFQEKGAFRLSLDNVIESVVWSKERLFTSGLNGEVVEWNTTTMQPLRQQRVTGNSIWCLAVNQSCTELAIGTEEGYINIFDIENDEFQYKLLFDKQEGRVLCCSFDATGNYLVTGSIEVLRVWDARTGHALRKMTFPKAVDDKETIIWTLRVLKDFSIVTGDSRGYITVYDGHSGAHLEHHQVLKADVLALNVNETEDMLICSGVEPIIRIYAKTQIKREDTIYYRWVKYLQRAVHDHDVKSLMCGAKDRIISGGVDGYLGISSITRMRSTISKHGPFLRQPFASVSGKANLLLLRYTDFLEIWRLGEFNQDAKDQLTKKSIAGKSLSLTSSPSKLLELRSKNGEQIVCAAISLNGQWICYATQKETRLFQLTSTINPKGKQILNVERCKNTDILNVSATNLEFCNDDSTLFLLSNTKKELFSFELIGDYSFELKKTIDISKHIKNTITHFKISTDKKYFVIADDNHVVSIWRNFEHYINVPRYETAATTALTLHSNLPRIAIAYSDSRIVEYDLENACFSCWYDHSDLIPNTDTFCVSQILFDERNPDILILQNDGFLYALEKYAANEEHNKEMTKKSKTSPTKNKGRQMLSLRLKFQKSFEHLVHTCWISDYDLLTINVNRSILLDKLPPAFRQKKYGTT